MNHWIAGSIAFERLEPCAGKLACTVLRGVGSSNAACLLDFAFLGSQHRVTLAGEDFYIDLLMYHVKLRAYVVIELKAGKFKPEYAGKLSFYLTAIDKEVKLPDDNPTIGLLLCQSSNKLMVEYCLSDIRKPVGVSEYRTVTETLPKELETILPTPEQFQHLLDTLPSTENNKE